MLCYFFRSNFGAVQSQRLRRRASKVSIGWTQLTALQPEAGEKGMRRFDRPQALSRFLQRFRPGVKDRKTLEEKLRQLFLLALGRQPTEAEMASLDKRLRNGEAAITVLIETLADAKDLGNSQRFCFETALADVRDQLTEDAREMSQRLARHEHIPRNRYEELYRQVFASGRELIIGQHDYGAQHKQRFRELFNACQLLIEGYASPRILEFGTSEFSAIYKRLWPEARLHLSDRPVATDYPGFQESVARRLADLEDYHAVDLEGGRRAVEDSTLAGYRFDLIVFTEVLEHLLVHPVEILGVLLDLLTPQGHLYLTTPNFFRRENLEKLATFENPQEIYPVSGGNWDRHHHHREYGARELLHFIAQAGGEPAAFCFSDCWGEDPSLSQPERSNLVLVARKSARGPC